MTNTSTGDSNKLISGFPCFTATDEEELGFLAFGNYMLGENNLRLGVWDISHTKQISSGIASGPLVLFNADKHSAVISSLVNPMAGSAVYGVKEEKTTSSWGVMGMVESVPKDFEYWTILHFSDQGINRNFDSWSHLMRKYYNKNYSYRNADFINNYIGYWTDNGAYYYYLTEPNKNYQDTIVDVYEYSKRFGIPYRYIQYDSWWYPKDPKGGVTEWVAKSDIFPDGFHYLWENTGLVMAAHNKWWSDKTKYAKVNGGKYNFIVEVNTTQKSIPDDWRFWKDLFQISKEWGLMMYEQDWLSQQFVGTDCLLKNVTLGRTWLKQMGKGAAMNGITIQYCTALSRHALQSLEIPAVTQARVSDDYQPGNDQWKIGITSIFAHQLAIAPFKDTFWTTQNQSGNTYHRWEPYPELQSLVATLSTGPVGPSDKVGLSDVRLIMKSCNSDGLILKPSIPAMAIDQQFVGKAFGNFMGEVWTTYSDIAGLPFIIFFGADFAVSDAVYLTPSDINFPGSLPDSKVFTVYNPSDVKDFSYNSPIKMSGCTKAKFCLYFTTPKIKLQDKELVLLGELDKWVPMSSKRISDIAIGTSNVEITINGGVWEKVMFTYIYDGQSFSVSCVMSSAGSAVLSIIGNKCISL